jgi:hypothetical protein
MEGHHRHGRYWKLGGGALSVVGLLMAAQFGRTHYLSGMLDDAAIPSIKEQQHHASNEPLVDDSNMVHLLSRVWNATGNNYSWCVPPRPRKNVVNGLVYVKVPKTASSTSAGVTLQISRNIGRKMLGSGKSCSNSHEHGAMFRNRKPPYLLWTTIRHPAKRAISSFFYHGVTRHDEKTSSENMLKLLRRSKNFQLKYISTEKIPSNKTHLLAVQGDPLELIRINVFEHYHFIAITERMDESLVVMKMLWGLSDRDIIVMSTKRSGGYDNYRGKCVTIHPSFTTPQVDDYIRTNFTKDNHDYLLYAAVNESLDLTIAALGKLRFAEELERYLGLKKIADDACSDKTHFPCTSTGKLQVNVAARNCLFGDNACGYRCVDKLFKNHSLY